MLKDMNRKKREKYLYLVIIVFIVLVRLALSARLPAWILPELRHDDQWMVSSAGSILNGEWLGDYDQFTLIKGVFSPLLLAFSYISGFTFIGLNTLLYCGSCLLFLHAIKVVIKSRILRISFLILLLFNPITYALQTGQRIYRNGMSQWQLLVIFGCFIALYIHRFDHWYKSFFWSLLGGFSLWAFMNTREDGIWMIPFILCAVITTVISYLFGYKNKQSPLQPIKLVIFVLPVFILIIGNAIFCFLNQSHYGVYLKNDRDSGNYALVMRDLYLVKPKEEDEELYTSDAYKNLYYNIYVSTLNMAYEVSPTLSSIRTEIDNAISGWDAGEDLVDGQPAYDHILFAIRNGVANAGYYHNNLQETEAFYGQIHKELETAFKTGKLEKRGISLSALSAPYQKRYLPEIWREFCKAFHTVISFEGVYSSVETVKERSFWLSEFERLSGSRAIIFDEDTLKSSEASSFSELQVSSVQPYTQRANRISLIYQKCGTTVFCVSLFGYFCLCAQMAAGIKKPNEHRTVVWLLTTGLVLSMVLFVTTIAYMTATTFFATVYLYLSSAYIMDLMFCGVILCYYFERIIEKLQMDKSSDVSEITENPVQSVKA